MQLRASDAALNVKQQSIGYVIRAQMYQDSKCSHSTLILPPPNLCLLNCDRTLPIQETTLHSQLIF